MNSVRFIITLIVLIFLAACQPAAEVAIPTLAQLATVTPSGTPRPPTRTASPAPPTATATATASSTVTPTTVLVIRISLTPSATVSPTATPTALPDVFAFGRSVEGLDLVAYRLGTGQRVIMIIGGIHAGYEANTIRLVGQMRDHFRRESDAVLADVTLIFVPVLNPDGYEAGRDLRGRFNAHGVDLNRNWDCGWSAEAFFKEERVNPGTAAFSEPETTALGSLIHQIQPAAVLFYHAAADGIFAGDCRNGQHVSDELAALYGEVAGYPYGTPFSDYPVSGTAPSWVDSLGIPAIDIELSTADQTEFDRNLRAITALQNWAARR